MLRPLRVGLYPRGGRHTSLIRAALQAAPRGQNERKFYNQWLFSVRDRSNDGNIQRLTEFEDAVAKMGGTRSGGNPHAGDLVDSVRARLACNKQLQRRQ